MLMAVKKKSSPSEKKSAPVEQKVEKPIKRLYRSGKDKLVAGVCGGIAEYLEIDPVIVRLLWAISVVFYGTGLVLYLIAWVIIPRNPEHKWEN